MTVTGYLLHGGRRKLRKRRKKAFGTCVDASGTLLVSFQWPFSICACALYDGCGLRASAYCRPLPTSTQDNALLVAV